MHDDMLKYCKKYLEMYKRISSYLGAENRLAKQILIVTSLFYNTVPDMDKIKEKQKQIEENDEYKIFRGNFKYIYAYKFLTNEEGENLLYNTINGIELFKLKGLEVNQYTTLAAFMYAAKGLTDIEPYIDRTIAIFNYIKEHINPEMSDEDYIYCGVISIMYWDVEEITEELLYISNKLKEKYDDTISKYATMIIIFGNEDKDEKIEKFEILRTLLDDKGIVTKGPLDVAALSFLLYMDMPIGDIVNKLKVFYNYLDFDNNVIDVVIKEDERVVFAILLFCQYHILKNNLMDLYDDKTSSSLMLAKHNIIFIMVLRTIEIYDLS